MTLRLTPAQERVVPFVRESMTYQQIAQALGIAPRTARSHVEAIAIQLPPDEFTAYRRVQRWAYKALAHVT